MALVCKLEHHNLDHENHHSEVECHVFNHQR
jgi:hypothetical protein